MKLRIPPLSAGMKQKAWRREIGIMRRISETLIPTAIIAHFVSKAQNPTVAHIADISFGVAGSLLVFIPLETYIERRRQSLIILDEAIERYRRDTTYTNDVFWAACKMAEQVVGPCILWPYNVKLSGFNYFNVF